MLPLAEILGSQIGIKFYEPSSFVPSIVIFNVVVARYGDRSNQPTAFISFDAKNFKFFSVVIMMLAGALKTFLLVIRKTFKYLLLVHIFDLAVGGQGETIRLYVLESDARVDVRIEINRWWWIDCQRSECHRDRICGRIIAHWKGDMTEGIKVL